jgi:hypothetical protein
MPHRPRWTSRSLCAVAQDDRDHRHLEHVEPADRDHGAEHPAAALDPHAAATPLFEFGRDRGHIARAGLDAGGSGVI